MVRGVQTPRCTQAGSDFIMAVQTFEHRLAAAQLVARRALCRTVQVLVGARKWTRRDLRASHARDQAEKDQRKQGSPEDHRQISCNL